MSQAVCTRVNMDSLVVDGRYQRPPDERRIAKIIDGYDAKLLGTLEVSKRSNGTYAIIDGQHRFEALKAVGRKQVPALVHEGLTVQQEADLFARTNMGRKPLTPVQRFKAQVFAGDQTAVDIAKIVTKYGFKITDDNFAVASGQGVIRSITTLEQIYKRGGTPLLDKTLAAISDLWFGIPGCTDGSMIAGMGQFMHIYGDRFDERHAERLRREEPIMILRRAKGIALRSSGQRIAMLVADQLRKATGVRGTTGRSDTALLSKAASDELATI